MAAENLNPILNPDCDCPVAPAATPTPCPAAVPLDQSINVLPEVICGSCEDTIVPLAPTVTDIAITKKCLTADPAYEYLPATDRINGLTHRFFVLHPGCARPMQLCTYCIEENLCDEDIGLVKGYGNDNIFSIQLGTVGVNQPLLFYVADGYRDRILSEVGYIKVMQDGTHNEWMPKDEAENGFEISPSTMFVIAQNTYLNEVANTGIIPTLVTETAVTSTACA